jgi:hypothetical protein
VSVVREVRRVELCAFCRGEGGWEDTVGKELGRGEETGV